ncbi:Inositol 2-dehydrogenase/D-chiro-inositol 3-dehydrogenase [Paenibacillus solanacearum]|uniref:Inositol 2-dehydrogenase/D-chiro-inositol 3-dehydrogenase n=1 Tax=Paenibacillus solanacearum TaxID=2048548 RepID=A0A916K8T4_9BACL|nr:Gfo/Idh/MocA family oxidoreductase [Paenibacillus solanacearum]CAG7645838.1 Inositol 2-dehydrogenase/D-chiro-inositol 3-dehydrogenase [Paenibacillus solanacearum]
MRVGVIGYGSRIRSVLNEVKKQDPAFELAAIVDIRKNDILSQHQGDPLDNVQWYGSPEHMMEEAKLDGVLIGTRCSLHTEMALKVLPYRLPLFLEKPVATTLSDLQRLKEGGEAHNDRIVVSFPLRTSRMVQLVKEIIDSGKIGTVEHVQAVNNVTYGGVYYHNWYRDENETGGLFLQKATHDFDYLNYVLQQRPVSVCAMTSKQVFKGDKPAGLKCADCEDNRTCEESTAFAPEATRKAWPYCSFAVDTGNEDSGSALVRYESGMHLSYSQNFFVRRKAGARGARFMGYKGTVEFDFYTSEVKVLMHHTPLVETHRFDTEKGHFGGDAGLATNFVGIMQGKETSVSTLNDGLVSALLCLKARESAQNGTFQSIDWL